MGFLSFKFYTRIKSDLCITITVLQDSVFVYIFTFTGEFSVFQWFYVLSSVFASTWRTLSSNSYKRQIHWWLTLSAFVYLVRSLFLWVLKGGFSRYSIVVGRFFVCFSALNISSTTFWIVMFLLLNFKKFVSFGCTESLLLCSGFLVVVSGAAI